MVALEEPQLVAGQAEHFPPLVERGDPPEQPFVEGNLHLMLGELRGVVAGDRLERVIVIARIEIGEHPADPFE